MKSRRNMDIHEREMPWVKRVEELIKTLDGSSVGELELREAGTEIIIKRRPDMMLIAAPTQAVGVVQPMASGGARPVAPAREDRSQPVVAPLTGVYYSSPSPSAPPF